MATAWATRGADLWGAEALARISRGATSVAVVAVTAAVAATAASCAA